MDMMMLIVAIPVITLIVALIFQPIAQKRREREMWEHMKNARDANEAKAIADSSIDAIRSDVKLPEHWNASYRFWNK
jgi:hypothetical protein